MSEMKRVINVLSAGVVFVVTLFVGGVLIGVILSLVGVMIGVVAGSAMSTYCGMMGGC